MSEIGLFDAILLRAEPCANSNPIQSRRRSSPAFWTPPFERPRRAMRRTGRSSWSRWRATTPTGHDLPQGLRHRERDVQGARSARASDGRAVSAHADFRGMFIGHIGERRYTGSLLAERPRRRAQCSLGPSTRSMSGARSERGSRRERLSGGAEHPPGVPRVRIGHVITTDHIRCEDEVEALLGLPPTSRPMR